MYINAWIWKPPKQKLAKILKIYILCVHVNILPNNLQTIIVLIKRADSFQSPKRHKERIYDFEIDEGYF